MSYFPQTDGTVLLDVTIASLSTSSAINTSGYRSISIQLSANAGSADTFTMYLEGSNDQVYWSTINVMSLAEFAIMDHIEINGNFTIQTSTQYIRYNVTKQSGPLDIIMVGRLSEGPRAADMLSVALSSVQATPLNVNLMSGLLVDNNRALILADNKQYPISGIVGTLVIIDTTGYNSISIHSQNFASPVACSDDGINWMALSGVNKIAGTAIVSAITASGSFNFPALGRYIRLTFTTSGAGTVYLKNQQWAGNYLASYPNNLTAINGTAAVTGGLAGTLAIGAASANAVAPTYNYLGVAGVDTVGLARRVLTDGAGRQYVTAFNPISNVNAATSTLGLLSSSYQNTGALNVQDTTLFEGQSKLELLSQILLELRIANQQLAELPILLNLGANAILTPPEAYRNDSTVFAQ